MIKYKKLKKLLIWTCKQKKVGSSQLPSATRMAELEEIEPTPCILLPCTSCNRTFRPEALAKHAQVCEKSLMKKRKKFDSSKQRLQGTDLAVFPPPVVNKPGPVKKESPSPHQVKLKERQQVELTKSLLANRKRNEAAAAARTAAAVAASSKAPDHDKCPYCQRHFGPKAYERHTEWCKEQQNKIKHNNNNINLEAKERLEVRTKYRAPLTSKVLTRDKYNPRSRDPSPASRENMPSPMVRSSSQRLSSRSKTVVVDSVTKTKKQENKSGTSSARCRSHETNKVETERAYCKSPTPPKILTGSIHGRKIFPQVVRHVVAAVLPKRFSLKNDDAYDPFASAEQQLLELLGVQPSQPTRDSPDKTPESQPETPQSPPISAFALYTPVKSIEDVSTDIAKAENKENNNDSDGTLSPQEPIDNRKQFSLSSLSLCSIVSLDSVDYNRNLGPGKYFKNRDDGLQRSFSATEGKSNKYGNRVKLNMHQMLYGLNSPQSDDDGSNRGNDADNLQACEAELLASMLEFEKMLNSSPPPLSTVNPSSSPDNIPSPENSECRKKYSESSPDSMDAVKLHQPPLSIDSAYGSLTRGAGDAPELAKSEIARFCHECGSKYPVPSANFCCNCGVRRVAI